MTGVQRYDIKTILSDPKQRRRLITTTMQAMILQQGRDVSLRYCEKIYDAQQKARAILGVLDIPKIASEIIQLP